MSCTCPRCGHQGIGELIRDVREKSRMLAELRMGLAALTERVDGIDSDLAGLATLNVTPLIAQLARNGLLSESVPTPAEIDFGGTE